MSIRMLIADDHEVIRTGLASLLANTDIEIVAEATNGNEAIAEAEKCKPDVILLDIRMPDGDGLSTLEKLRTKVPDSCVVMLSTYDNPTYVARAVALGACDYVLKGSSRQKIIETIRNAAEGTPPGPASALGAVAGAMSEKRPLRDTESPLTRRETQVLRHVALGLSNKEIGQSLEISIETVKEHVQNVLRKIGVRDRTQAAVWAVRRELV